MTEQPQAAAKAPPRRKLKRDIARILGVLLFFLSVAWLLQQRVVRDEVFNIDRIRAHVQHSGWRGVLAFIGAAALANAMGIPRLWVSAAAGSLYGAAYGILVGLVASLLGSSIDFLLGRTVLRGPVKRRMPQRMRRWYDLLNRHGFRAILYMRLFPFANATMTNLLGGVSRMRFRSFLLASFLGFIPFTVAFATLGSSAAKQNWMQMALGTGVLVAVIAGQWIWRRRHKRMEVERTGDTE